MNKKKYLQKTSIFLKDSKFLQEIFKIKKEGKNDFRKILRKLTAQKQENKILKKYIFQILL